MFERIKNLFRKAGANVGMVKSLTNITDDDRINIPQDEYERIRVAFNYYKNEFPKVDYKAIGDEKEGAVTKKRAPRTLNMTKTSARRIASIVFNEKCKISYEDKALNEFMNSVFESNDFFNLFETNLEKGVAAGGFVIRPYVADNKIKLAWVRADQFYPLRSNTNDISECAIASKTQRIEGHQTVYYTLLEFHQWDKDENGNDIYNITNELYRSTSKNEVGIQVPLNTIYDDLQESVTMTGLIAPMFAYFRCPGANNCNLESPLGVGVVDNAKDQLDDINMVNDMTYSEIKLGRKRVSVPANYLRYDNDVHKPYFDTDEQVYEGLGGSDSDKIQDLTTNFRIVQLKDAMDHAIKKFETQIGLSAGTFSYANDGVKTATEVVSNNSMTYQTRSSYLTQVEKVIKALSVAIIQLAQASQFYDDGKPLFSFEIESADDMGMTISFDDGVFVDKDKQLEEDLKALTARALPTKQFLIRNYGLSDVEADEWLDEIKSETPEPSTQAELGTFGSE